MWYNKEVAERTAASKEKNRSLKIEQQERSTKHIFSRNKYVRTNSIHKENTTQTKVKEQSSSKKDIKCLRTFHIPFFESLILAQDERWRRA